MVIQLHVTYLYPCELLFDGLTLSKQTGLLFKAEEQVFQIGLSVSVSVRQAHLFTNL